MHFVLPLTDVLVALAPPLGVAQKRAQSPQDPAEREPPAATTRPVVGEYIGSSETGRAPGGRRSPGIGE